MKKPTQTPAKSSPRAVVTKRPAKLDATALVRISGGCTNENLSTVVIK